MSGPRCPYCRGPMAVRRNRRDGSEFWGCSRYPRCRGTVSMEWASASIEDGILIERDVVRSAVTLCHPDRHPEERQELATRVTARLLGHLQGIAS